jgi:hypothetical protein
MTPARQFVATRLGGLAQGSVPGPAELWVALSPGQAKAILFEHDVWSLSFDGGDDTAGLGLASLERGGRRSTLLVTLAAEPPSPDAFWAGIRQFARRHHVTRLSVESFGPDPGGPPIPIFPGERERYSGVRLYVIELEPADIYAGMSENHRRNVKKATKAGVRVSRTTSPEAFRAHVDLIGSSIQRRSDRGEPTNLRADPDLLARLLTLKSARLHQAALDGDVLSSVLVYTVGRSAFYDSGGSSPRGMTSGSSHYLMYQVTRDLRAEGIATLNLDVASSAAGGLARYKADFGAREWKVNRAVFEWRHPVALALTMLSGLLRRR